MIVGEKAASRPATRRCSNYPITQLHNSAISRRNPESARPPVI